MQEVWKPISGFELFYEVSNLGRVRSLDRICQHKDGQTTRRAGRVLKPGLRAGYPFVQLCDNETKKQEHVHRLVAQAFCVKPEGCNVVNHLDGDRQNNLASNLEWTTNQGNITHAYRTGLAIARKGEEIAASKLRADQVRSIRLRLINGESCGSLAKEFGIAVMTVSDIRRGVRWNTPEDSDLIEQCRSSAVYTAKGERHPAAKISEADVRDIIQRLISKQSQKEIAKLYSVNPVAISNINMGIAWSHVRVDGCGEPPYFLLRSRRKQAKPDSAALPL
ncbi:MULTISPECIES: NUMOD4 domain-containing protein [Pseudomonas]|uniref:HNH endonuclease n=1 Tax=Pseudomonas lutea TaxID=243924 RepID=A0A9X8QM48_9PSED|nr:MULTISPECIES: NUMOD4 domain-containing protein [Pseudomonas]SER52388.1 HNH endonuclease [Pseudomonas lutea]SER52710.1 HNH endonuclease [Pseudomonas lutea]